MILTLSGSILDWEPEIQTPTDPSSSTLLDQQLANTELYSEAEHSFGRLKEDQQSVNVSAARNHPERTRFVPPGDINELF